MAGSFPWVDDLHGSAPPQDQVEMRPVETVAKRGRLPPDLNAGIVGAPPFSINAEIERVDVPRAEPKQSAKLGFPPLIFAVPRQHSGPALGLGGFVFVVSGGGVDAGAREYLGALAKALTPL
jgi:hypothetical protein